MKSVFYPQIIKTLKNYSLKQFSSDIIAGVIVAIIALPLSIALSLASGASPEKGLYTAIIAGFVISLLGGSKVNISGPTAAFATIVAGIINDESKGFEGLIIATILAGIILIILGLLRAGTLIKYIPKTITIGFTGGIAVTILIGQIKDFLGLTFAKGVRPVESLEKLEAITQHLNTTNIMAVILGVVCLFILVFWPKISKKIPGSLVVVLIGTALVKICSLNVDTIGDLYRISSSLPSLNIPNFNLNLIVSLIPDAITIAILAGIESLLSCVVSDTMINDKHNSNTELIAQGVGNICVGFFGGIPATGAIARTAANVKNGGRSPIAGITHAIVLFFVLIILMPYAAWIPMPVIATILFIVAYNMSEWREFVHVIKSKNIYDIIILILTFLLTVIFDLVVAIVIGLALHYVLLLLQKIKTKKV